MRSGSSPAAVRPLRSDARANRERILAAAKDALAEDGLDASVLDIAQRAGLGIGTLYRHFPTKTALVDAIFAEHVDELVAAGRIALNDPDAWHGLCAFFERAVSLQAQNRGFAEICAIYRRDESLAANARARIAPLLRQLLRRAQKQGALRPDVAYEDISLLLWSCGRIVDSTRRVAPDFWRRHLRLTLDGLRAAGASPLPEPPLTGPQHRKAMRHLARELRLAGDGLA